MASNPAVDESDARSEPRDAVDFRARAVGQGGRAVTLQVVNMSASGLMARGDDFPVGERLLVTLPVIGAIAADVRWSLGGRLGCQLDRPIPLATYYNLLAAMVRR